MKKVIEVCLLVGVSVGVSAVMVYANQCVNPTVPGSVTIEGCEDSGNYYAPSLTFSDPYGKIAFTDSGIIEFGNVEGEGEPLGAVVAGGLTVPLDCTGQANYTITTASSGAVASLGDTGSIVIGDYYTDSEYIRKPDPRGFTGVYCGATSKISRNTRAQMRVAVPLDGGEGEDEPLTSMEVLDNTGNVTGSVSVAGDPQDTDQPATVQMGNASGSQVLVAQDGSIIVQLGAEPAQQQSAQGGQGMFSRGALSQGAEATPAPRGFDVHFIERQAAEYLASHPATP